VRGRKRKVGRGLYLVSMFHVFLLVQRKEGERDREVDKDDV